MVLYKAELSIGPLPRLSVVMLMHLSLMRLFGKGEPLFAKIRPGTRSMVCHNSSTYTWVKRITMRIEFAATRRFEGIAMERP